MRLLRTSIGVNLVVSVILVLAWLAYAGLSGIPIDQHCMGFYHGRGGPIIARCPVWLGPLSIEVVFLSLYLARNYLNQPKLRFFIAAFSLWSLGFGIVPPLLNQQVYGITFFSWDKALWWYACVSNFAYGLFGSNSERHWSDSALPTPF